MFKEETKPPKEKAHVLKNTLYMLKIALKCAPLSLITIYLVSIFCNVYYAFVINVYFIEITLSMIENGVDFKRFALTVCLIAAGKLAADVLDWWKDYTVRIRFEIRCESYINSLLFTQAQRVELACFEDPDFFNKYSRATWIVERGGFKRIIEGTSYALGSFISFMLLCVYLIRLDPFMTVFLLCPALVIFFRSKRFKIDYRREKEQTRPERRKDYIRRTVLLKDFAKDIKTTGIFKVLRNYFDKAINENISLIKKYGVKMLLWETAGGLFASVVPVGGGFVYSCVRLVGGFVTVSEFTVLISAVMKAKDRLMHFTQYFGTIQKQCLWVESMREFLAYEPKIKGGNLIPGEFESLEVKNVSFRYEGANGDTLKNVSFKINKGETVAVVGSNGAGKTTLSKLLMRLYDVTEGEILYNGVNIKEYDLLKFRAKFASVFQDYRIFAMTAAENILMEEVGEDNLPTAEKAARLSGIAEKIDALANSYNTNLTKEFDENGASLSGGETQKLSISRLFARSYFIAVLDEPSSALDPVAEAEIYKNIEENLSDKTVIFISHRLSSAASADKVLVFSQGALAESGTHAELMERGGEYAAMFTLQASGYREEVGDGE